MRGWVRVVGGLLLGFVLVMLGGPASAAPGESISRYHVAMAVEQNGDLRITEEIDYAFAGSGHHGIVRKIPAKARYDDRRDRVYPIGEVRVTRGGSPEDVSQSSEDGYQIFTIGSSGRTVSGTQKYVIQYTV